ncbi:unnamed protein product [Symbiodinium sp. KB8]|nr:unnamed protein product [Symbiodinium sp. KB8]
MVCNMMLKLTAQPSILSDETGEPPPLIHFEAMLKFVNENHDGEQEDLLNAVNLCHGEVGDDRTRKGENLCEITVSQEVRSAVQRLLDGSLALADADELLLSAREPPANFAAALSLRLLDAREEDEADEGLLAFVWWLFCWPRWWSLRRHLAKVLPPAPADRNGTRAQPVGLQVETALLAEVVVWVLELWGAQDFRGFRCSALKSQKLRAESVAEQLAQSLDAEDGRGRMKMNVNLVVAMVEEGGTVPVTMDGGGYYHAVRHLTPRGDGRCSPAMSMGDATCFWLHTMGLRNGTATDDRRALDPSRHDGRVDAIMGVRPEDLVMVMAALMRTLAMLVVESSQLMMMRVQQQPNHGEDEEVEVTVEEEGDEEVWMQTDLSGPVKRQRSAEQLAEDEHHEKLHREAEQRLAQRQQDAREAEEMEQARQDEVLWEQHRAALYRAWEEWEVANFVPAPPRRLRAIVRLTQGNASEQMVCSVPLTRGSPVELAVTLHEQVPPTVIPEPSGVDEAGDPGGLCSRLQVSAQQSPAVQVEAGHMAGYDRWRSGGLSDAQVEAQFGADMLAMFVAQRLVEEDLNEMESCGADEGVGSGRVPGMEE